MTVYMFPGQGSQKVGMGDGLFERYPEIIAKADAILGYSIKTLCLEDPDGRLNLTQYTQPALFVVSALMYLELLRETGRKPDFVAGHSLGEYNALFAAGAFDFEAGLRLVQKRGALMAEAGPGGMAAVLRLDRDRIESVLRDNGLDAIDIANFNSPDQIVVSGPKDEIERAKPFFEETGCAYKIIKVTSAFHSRYMRPSREAFAEFLDGFTFESLLIPTIANVTARPYRDDEIKKLLADQIDHSVNWTDSVRYLMGRGEADFVEVGPGKVLKGLHRKIHKLAEPLIPDDEVEPAMKLGADGFRTAYGLRYAYVAAALHRNLSGYAMAERMANAGMLAYIGTDGLSSDEVRELAGRGNGLGFSLRDLGDEARERAMMDALIESGVRYLEVTNYAQVTPQLLRYRLAHPDNRLMVRLTRAESAEVFLNPPPERVLEALAETGLDPEPLRQVATATDLCVQADGGGPTEQGSLLTFLPAVCAVRDRLAAPNQPPIYVGAMGGLGTPDALTAAFVLGADFVMTGSVNQCTVEAATSTLVKDMLAEMGVGDTAYVPDGDLFSLGGVAQVLKKGVFFPARAAKLRQVFQQVESLDHIDDATRDQLEQRFFRRSFDEIWREIQRDDPSGGERVADRPKQKMAKVFQWYFDEGHRLAAVGDVDRKVDFHIHAGPALGAFNQWVKDSELEDWRSRHVDDVGLRLMRATAENVRQRLETMTNFD